MGTLANIKSIFKHHPQSTNVHKYTTKLSASEESSTFPYNIIPTTAARALVVVISNNSSSSGGTVWGVSWHESRPLRHPGHPVWSLHGWVESPHPQNPVWLLPAWSADRCIINIYTVSRARREIITQWTEQSGTNRLWTTSHNSESPSSRCTTALDQS